MKEHDVVQLIDEINSEGERIEKGTKGTLVSAYRNGLGYAVEFETGSSAMLVTTVYPTQIQLVQYGDRTLDEKSDAK